MVVDAWLLHFSFESSLLPFPSLTNELNTVFGHMFILHLYEIMFLTFLKLVFSIVSDALYFHLSHPRRVG